jgi:hypothetical protein
MPTPAPAPAPAPTVSGTQPPDVVHQANGHDMFVFHDLTNTGADIANFNPKLDTLDLAPLLHSVGYTGTNPFTDGTLTIQKTAAGGSAVVLDAHTDHSTTVATLEHVLPTHLPHSDIIWH